MSDGPGLAENSPRLTLRYFLLQVALYIPLVALYLALVLTWLSDPIVHLYQTHARWEYAAAALALVMGQAFVLEAVTRLVRR